MKENCRFQRVRTRVSVVAALVSIGLVCLWVWTWTCEKNAHHRPGATRVSLEEVLKKEIWDDGDFRLLSDQTGLAKEVLVSIEERGRRKELAGLQEAYFAPVQVKCVPNSIISKTEYLVDDLGTPVKGMKIPYIEEGDILITNCSHVFGWRNGHAAIVVDADRRLVLEAQVLGSPSMVVSLGSWEEYPSFVVLRLEGAGRKERAAIAEYAKKYLVGVHYRVSAGIWDRLAQKDQGKDEGIPAGTHCAHLVWYVYELFGYDLDSDGGVIVTPKDIANSERLKIIQKYGVG